jgi:DNA-binding NtrC family response regulator
MTLPPKPAPKTILLVENEPLLLKFGRVILETAGFMVRSAPTAEEATRIDQEYTGTIDLLLTAFSLPRGSGPELADQLAWSRPGLPVVLMSGYTAVRAVAANHGWGFIEKPFLPSALLDGIGEALQLAVPVAVVDRPLSDLDLSKRPMLGVMPQASGEDYCRVPR